MKPLTSRQKAQAWKWAAELIEFVAVMTADCPQEKRGTRSSAEHALAAIVPSLKRRAAIIERNGKR
jgi:hypothetical protein